MAFSVYEVVRVACINQLRDRQATGLFSLSFLQTIWAKLVFDILPPPSIFLGLIHKTFEFIGQTFIGTFYFYAVCVFLSLLEILSVFQNSRLDGPFVVHLVFSHSMLL